MTARGQGVRRILVALVVTTLVAACDSPTAPPPPPPPNGGPPGPLLSVSIQGNRALTAIGETSQLAVIARSRDGSTRDVTSEVAWDNSGGGVVTVSQSGLLTAVGYGAALISWRFEGHARTELVTASPPGTFAVSHVVGEPFDTAPSGGLANVRVLDPQSGRSVMTDDTGRFTLAELPSPPQLLRLEKDGYEPREVPSGQWPGRLIIQPVVGLTGDAAYTGALMPADVSYAVGQTICFPCRLVRIFAAQPGTVHIRVSWTPAFDLALFANGQLLASGTREITADVPVAAPGELFVYFGSAFDQSIDLRVSFTFETRVGGS